MLCGRRAALAVGLGLVMLPGNGAGGDSLRPVVGTQNNEMLVVNSYPEYWVDGKPFFMHSAAFFYHRIPRHRWAEELLRLKGMGINTIDLYPFWNWHEPREGNLDFDGRTNPQRDLKHLLRLVQLMGFKLTFRPGPFFSSEWRNGGYPDWLLRKAGIMSEQAILEGRYPRWSALQYKNSEEAAAKWLGNDTHLRTTRKWYREVLSLLAPFLAEKDGPLINLQIDDDQGIGRENYNGPDFYRYASLLRRYAQEATNESRIPYYLNGADMRVNAEPNAYLQEPLWNVGQYYQMGGAGIHRSSLEAARTKFLTEILKTQPLFVPMMMEFQAGWFASEHDTYAQLTDPSNTLLASRVMIQNALKGINNYPVHDTLYPAGYESPWANHFYTWEAAVNFAGQETGRAVYVRRNGRLVAGMGPLLASTHLLADAGLVYPMATFPQDELTPAETNLVANFAGRVLWSGVYEHFNFELVDSDHTPPANFQRYQVLLLPNLVSGKDEQERYPHLGQHSEKAQRAIVDYVAAGGALIVFPSLPKGRLFDELFAPFGQARRLSGDSPLRFANGVTALSLGSRHVLTLPKKPRVAVKTFARDGRGSVVGARFAHGKGQVVFFGADFSLWALPPAAPLEFEPRAPASARDYAEEVQRAARAVLPALMQEVGVVRAVRSEAIEGKPRELGLYLTELVSDWNLLPPPRGGRERPSFAFVGVTNLSPEQARSAEILVTDPRASEPGSAGSERVIRLPRLTVPPCESLLLPVRIPLSNPHWEMAPGLDPSDEVYYATAELTRVTYDGTSLRLEFTVPTDGEIALRLANSPPTATLDGQEMRAATDSTGQLFVVRLPKGKPPHFIRQLELTCPGQGPRVAISPRGTWIVGETRAVRVRVENPRPAALEGTLDFSAGAFYSPRNPPLVVHIPPRSSREFSFPAEVPPDAVPHQPVQLAATVRERASPVTWTWGSEVIVRPPFDFRLTPILSFPLREDQSIPMVHPTLASVDLPEEANFRLWLKNWHDHEQVITLSAEGQALTFTPGSGQLTLPPWGETTVELRVAPQGGSGAYPFSILLRAGDYLVKEVIVLAAVRDGEAIAYEFDYDNDGFQDVILENRKVRLFVSPQAGGRAFAFVLKNSNANAFNSIGGMRDNFTTRFEPDDMKDLPAWTRANWLGLYNRPYTLRILESGAPRATARLEYEAVDIYPKGVKLERVLTLAGNQNMVLAETTITPRSIEKPQAYVLENSVSFRTPDQPNYRQWFAQGRAPEDLSPGRKLDLAASVGYVGALNQQTGDCAAIMLLSPAAWRVTAETHAALIRSIYPAFVERNRPHTYRVAYYFGRATSAEVEGMFQALKRRAG